MTIWKCVSCGTELPLNRRSDQRYCGCRCRVRAHRIRKGEGKHVRPTRKHGHTVLKAALGTVAAASAAAVAVEVVRSSQDARLAEQERKIADLEEQLRKSQAEKEELKRAQDGLRNNVEQLTKEGKEKEEQLCRARKVLNAARETVEMLRLAFDRSHEESRRDQKKLLEVSRELDKAQKSQQRISEAYGQLRQRLVESNQRVQSLIGHNNHLAGLAAAAHDELVAKVLFQLASRDSPQSQKALPAIGDKTESSRLKGELAQAKEQIKLLTEKAQARKALPASSAETSLALANRNIEKLTSEKQRLSEELKNARELARQWNENFRLLAQRFADVEVEIDEQRPIVRQSTLPEETESEKPGFFGRALTALGLLGTGAVLGMGAAAALGREDSAQTLIAAPEHKVLGPAATQKALGSAPAQKALGPATQRLLPPKSES